ncbi:hypothetical protein [Pendulispora albinea]|uniref:Uncharacterized protein n=1 Tax=Pendulispora albinea TaxID=2741071 RepID=A0ABZ2M7U9_9BACT
MTARQKIEALTNSWYGFTAFSALFAILEKGLGFFTLAWGFICFLASLTFVFFIGRRLLAKGAVTRFILLIWSGCGTLFGTIAAGKLVLSFFGELSFAALLAAGMAVATAYMHVRSFRVLTDSSVRAYFNS